MAIGFNPVKRGMFGYKPPMATPGIGDGMDQIQPMSVPGLGMQSQQPQQMAKPNVGKAIAGTIGDYLLQANGMGAVYAPAMQQQQQAMMLEQKARQEQAAKMRERSLDRQDWQWKEDYERSNPTPTAMQKNLDYWQTLTPEQKAAYQEMNPVYRPGPDGQYYRVDVAQPQVLGTDLPEGWTVQEGTASNGGGSFLP